MIKVSLCMIVKNEEDVLERCLNSVCNIVDEIIIVDTGSTDKTKEIAKRFTDKIYDFKWIYDFSAARNYAYSKASMDYILWLDADDILPIDEAEKFKALKENFDEKVDVVMMKYNVGFDSSGKVTLSYFRERLSRRTCNMKWKEPIHEYLEISGKIINSDICIVHKKEHAATPNRNLSIYKSLINSGKSLSARGIYYYARELYYNGDYDEAIKYLNKFLDDKKGWVEDNISACFLLSICYDNKKDKESMLKILLKSFEYDTPRAEICCQLGNYYFESKDYNKAVFWYDLATRIKVPEDNWGFISYDYYGYIPHIQLCVCYDKLCDIKSAVFHNNKAGEIKPNDAAVEYNKRYFESIK